MVNFKLTIEYDGTNFKGWQIQKNGERTVQGELKKVAQRIFKSDIAIIASGRTDSGVHAKGQVINFKAQTRMKPDEIKRAFNSYLPEDIAVLDVVKVSDDFHAQYSVKEKTYRYTILNSASRQVFLRKTTCFYSAKLSIVMMRRAAKLLIGKHDFRSFQAHDPLRAERNTVRTIKRLTIKKEGELIHIDITADGFLYKMVRNITGSLLAVGAGYISLKDVKGILKLKDRTKAPATAPAHGLSLVSVKY